MMSKRVITWFFATIFALLTGTHALAGDGLRMVTATGRAVINDQAALHEASMAAAVCVTKTGAQDSIPSRSIVDAHLNKDQ